MNKLIVALALVASTAVAQTDPLVIEWVVPTDGKPWELTQDGDQLVTLEWPTSTSHNAQRPSGIKAPLVMALRSLRDDVTSVPTLQKLSSSIAPAGALHANQGGLRRL